MQIKFYEFGFATVSIFGMISLKGSRKNNTKVSPSDLLCIVNDLDEKIVNGEVQKIRSSISNITKKFDKTIKENKIKKFFASEKPLNEETNININNIRSLHRIFEYKVNKNSKIKVAQEALDKIAKLSNGQWKKENYFSHFVGIANSAIIYDCNSISNCKNIESKIFNQYKEAYETVLETANAYYFIAEFIKNGLYDYSRELVAIDKPKYIFKNRKKFNEVQERLNKFVLLSSNFSSAFDEFIINLSPQGKSIWDRMNKAWNTSKTTEMLKDQLQNSLQITRGILKQISNKVQFWLRNIAAIFTIIGAISLVEIAQSHGFDWDFHYYIWDAESKGEKVSMVINFLGSSLAVLTAIAISIVLPIWLIFRFIVFPLYRRGKNNN